MNLIEKTIHAIAPGWAVQRQKARLQTEMMESVTQTEPQYVGADKQRRGMKSWLPRLLSANLENTEAPTLVARSRDLYRNNSLVRSAINTTTTNVIGSGLKHKCAIDADFLGMSDEEADAWERVVEREFKFWCKKEHCDAAATLDFNGLQALAFLSTLQSGDVFATLPFIRRNNSPYALKVQLIEADRVCNKSNAMDTDQLSGGIETDIYGAPVAYHVMKTHPNGFDMKWEWVRIPAFGRKSGRRNVIHLFKTERPGQNRGLPFVAPIIEDLNLLGKYNKAELMAAVVSGMFTAFITTESGEGLSTLLTPENDGNAGSAPADEISMGYGAIVDLAKGENVNIANPGRPNPQFDMFVTAISRRIGAALEIPYELLIKHFTASYSASRAALLEAWKFFKMRRQWVADNFCQPIYDEWLAEAVANGRISAPGFFDDPIIRAAYSKCEWIGPAQGQIDPVKETKAAEMKINNDLSTRAHETAAIGGDWEANHRQRVKEERMRRENGLVDNTVL